MVDEDDLTAAIEKIPIDIDFTTSAKTGQNVEQLFESVASLVLAKQD